MDTRFSQQDEVFRGEIAAWLERELSGEFAALRGRGTAGDEHGIMDELRSWTRHLGQAGWNCVGWPVEYGGRGLSLAQQVIFYEEYARVGGPGRIGQVGEGLLGPTLIAFGSDEQKARFLPGIVSGESMWCQGYSEPNAGSDLANVQTRAVQDGDEWVIDGQKVWTSWAEGADWCFVLCRTDLEAKPKHRGISYLLVPMDQQGVEVRPIRQLNGGSEFSEVFYSGARTDVGNVVGGVNGGWKVAMGTLAFERGASTLGQQMLFQNELDEIIACAKRNGAARDPAIRQRIADAWIGLRIQRYNALRMLSADESAELGREAVVSKIFWATWHRSLGKLAMDVLGPESEITDGAPYELTKLQRMYLFSRSDTIYAGSNEIQRNIIAERALGLPREPRL